MFVAGALALRGFRSLLVAPYQLASSEWTRVAGSVIASGLAVLIGTAMLAGSERALWGARFYLLLDICLGLAAMCLSMCPISPRLLPGWRDAADVLTPAILFGMLAWSRSRHLQAEHDA